MFYYVIYLKGHVKYFGKLMEIILAAKLSLWTINIFLLLPQYPS